MVVRQDIGKVTFNLVEKTFATCQLSFLATRMAFYDILAPACAEIKILTLRQFLDEKVTYVFRFLDFSFFFFCLSFFSFSSIFSTQLF